MLVRVLLLMVVLTGLSMAALWWEYKLALTEPVVTEQPRLFEIKRGDSFNLISHHLVNQKIKITPLFFKLLAYQTKTIAQLKAGEYELPAGLTMPDMLALFVSGQSKQYPITFPEGITFKQMRQQIQATQKLTQTLQKMDDKAIMALLKVADLHPEGQFFPDTYFFTKGTTDFSLLKTAYNRMQTVLMTEWAAKSPDISLQTPYEALILASIIEKETAAAEERAEIAGVFIRRLQRGMLLQTDPTVIYGMGERYNGNIRRQDLKQTTAYNTYVIKGLPPTPIAMPGRDSIHAALHPAKGNSLYFVAKGQGRHAFSATLNEHNQAVNQYQR